MPILPITASEGSASDGEPVDAGTVSGAGVADADAGGRIQMTNSVTPFWGVVIMLPSQAAVWARVVCGRVDQ